MKPEERKYNVCSKRKTLKVKVIFFINQDKKKEKKTFKKTIYVLSDFEYN